jgi:hypothetical protein
MLKATNRKDKVETLKGLLTGSKTLKDLVEAKGEFKLQEYADCDEVPGVFYDRQGSQYSEAEIKARDEQLKGRGFLVWNETRTYNCKSELDGFFTQQAG